MYTYIHVFMYILLAFFSVKDLTIAGMHYNINLKPSTSVHKCTDVYLSLFLYKELGPYVINFIKDYISKLFNS